MTVEQGSPGVDAVVTWSASLRHQVTSLHSRWVAALPPIFRLPLSLALTRARHIPPKLYSLGNLWKKTNHHSWGKEGNLLFSPPSHLSHSFPGQAKAWQSKAPLPSTLPAALFPRSSCLRS